MLHHLLLNILLILLLIIFSDAFCTKISKHIYNYLIITRKSILVKNINSSHNHSHHEQKYVHIYFIIIDLYNRNRNCFYKNKITGLSKMYLTFAFLICKYTYNILPSLIVLFFLLCFFSFILYLQREKIFKKDLILGFCWGQF